MRPRRTQAWIVLILLSILGSRALGQATTQTNNRYAEQLRTECHQLLNTVIKKPYGWAWEATDAPVDEQLKKRHHAVVAMGPMESPAAGVVLLWAGEFLDDADLKEAAKQVARGVSAAKTGAGMVMNRPLFAANAGGKDERAYIPRRDSTIAGLALLLERLHADPDDAQSKTSAVRMTHWLLKQQAQNGAWPQSQPPDAEAKDAIRIIRLDKPDYRNSTLALLLAADVTQNKLFAEHAKKAIDLLVRMRLGRPSHSAGLWATAYTVEGANLNPDYGFPNGADALASRYALQTVIAGSIELKEKSYAPTIESAARTFTAARLEDETWPRFFDPGGQRRPSSTQPNRAGITTQPVVDLNAAPGKYGIDALIAANSKLQITNLDRYEKDLARYFEPRQHLVAAMAGLIDDPLVWQTPTTADEARAFLDQHSDDWKLLNEAPSVALSERIHRIWLLFLRAKIERIDGL